MKRVPARRGAAWPIVALALLALAASSGPYREGEEVVVTGVVTDRAGDPIPDLRVALTVSRATFSFLKMSRVKREPRTVETVTGADGEFRLLWPWHDYFNDFELEVGIVVQEPEGERLERLARLDLTRRVLKGGPVAASLTIDDTGPVADYREFLDGITSDDQRRIFSEMGRPGRVDRVALPDHEEVTWWYFGSGKAYRFADGRLENVVEFEPVESF